MKKLIMGLSVVFWGKNAVCMQKDFTVAQVREMLARCSEARRTLPIFDDNFIRNTSVIDMQHIMDRLHAAQLYCQGVGEQLQADGWQKAVRDVAACRKSVEGAICTLRVCIDYAHNPGGMPYPLQPVRHRVALQFDAE